MTEPAPCASARRFLVRAEHVSLFLPGDAERRLVLRDLCFQVRPGGHCAVLGVNGAGKSTLLRLLGGQLWPAAGTLLWHAAGEPCPEASPIAGRAMSAMVSPAMQEVWQRRAWDISGREWLALGVLDVPGAVACSASGSAPASGPGDPETARETARAMAREMALAAGGEAAAALGCADLLDRRVNALSQGQLRLLLLARALARRPELLLLDEWLDGLDAAHARRALAVLDRLAASGRTTLVIAAHRSEAMPDWCAERVLLDKGRLAPGGAGAPAVDWPCDAAAAGLPPEAGGMPGPSAPGRVLLALERVSVFIEREPVLHAVDWTLREGEHWRIAGANGAGKSTLLRLLAGDECAAAGGRVMRFLPSLGREASTLDEVRRGVRLVSDQAQALYGYPLTGLELVCSGFDNSVGLYREFSAAERDEARAALAAFFPADGGGRVAGQSIRRMSTGELRRLFLARALMGGPDILLLDEPCSGLDAASRAEYCALLRRLARGSLLPGGRRVSLVFVSHAGADAAAVCNREAVLERGRLTVTR